MKSESVIVLEIGVIPQLIFSAGPSPELMALLFLGNIVAPVPDSLAIVLAYKTSSIRDITVLAKVSSTLE